MSDNDTKQPLDHVSKYLFSQLDPILRLLLATIDKYRGLRAKNGTKHENNKSQGNNANEETLISLLKSQMKLLDTLLNELNNLIPSVDNEADYIIWSMALGYIATYVFLPLESILGYRDDESNSLSRKSYLWQCQQRSADAAVFMLRHCWKGSVESERKIGILTLCTANLSATNREVSTSSEANIRFDKGEEHSKALLRCSQVIIDQLSSHQISNSLEGQLMPRLALECTSILEPTPDYYRQDQEFVSEALNTLGALMKAVPDKQKWQNIFPGCVQGILRRIIQELRGPRESSTIICGCVDRLEQLLSVTMKSIESKTSINAIEQLRQLSINEKESRETKERDDHDSFATECNKRLPAVFNVIIKLMQVSKSSHTRSSAASLCRTLIMDCWPTWEIASREFLLASAFQCCIILQDDQNVSVKEKACHSLDCFRASAMWADFSGAVVSSILESIKELPSLTKTLRSTELNSKIKFIKGCLDLSVANGSLGLSPIGVAMETPEELCQIRSHLSSVFDVEFESLQERPLIEPSVPLDGMNVTQVGKFRFISNDSITLAKELVRSFGRALGYKRSFIFIDTCLYDLHNSFSENEYISQVSWLHDWIGVVTLLEEILVGLSTSHLAQNDGLDRRNRKRLKLLSSNLFPLITRSPIWSLTTIPKSNENENGTHEMEQSEYDAFSFDRQISANALKGNAFLIVSLLRFIRLLIRLLRDDTSQYLQILLFPIFEKASKQNHDQVRVAALGVLEEIRIACCWETLEDLICNNFDLLFQSLQNEMRLIRSSAHRGNLATIAKYIIESIQDGSRFPTSATLHRTEYFIRNIDLLVKIGIDLTSSFDRHLLGSQFVQPLPAILDIIEFYTVTLRYIARSFGVECEGIKFNLATSRVPDEPWLDLIKPFKKDPFNYGDETPDNSQEQAKLSIDISKAELDYVTLVLSRCSFFISHPSLLVQVSSCQVQKMAFLILGHISKNFTPNDDDDMLENPSNVIFRQISESWPAVSSRFKALSNQFVAAQKTQTLKSYVAPKLSQSDGSSDIIFLSRLLELIGVMSYVSGSFMWSRIQGDVWSTCASLLRFFLTEKSKTVDAVESYSPIMSQKEVLLSSLFTFFNGVFNLQELGQKAAPLISSIGSMIIPFIADKAPIGEDAMAVLESMISIDNDVLFRPLLATSGQGPPSYPFLQIDNSRKITNDGQSFCLLQLRAQELLIFSDSLPEQIAGIDY